MKRAWPTLLLVIALLLPAAARADVTGLDRISSHAQCLAVAPSAAITGASGQSSAAIAPSNGAAVCTKIAPGCTRSRMPLSRTKSLLCSE